MSPEVVNPERIVSEAKRWPVGPPATTAAEANEQERKRIVQEVHDVLVRLTKGTPFSAEAHPEPGNAIGFEVITEERSFEFKIRRGSTPGKIYRIVFTAFSRNKVSTNISKGPPPGTPTT